MRRQSGCVGVLAFSQSVKSVRMTACRLEPRQAEWSVVCDVEHRRAGKRRWNGAKGE